MKNTVLLLCLLLLTFSIAAQTPERKWNVGLHGGFTHYNGDLGNGFYRFQKAFYGHVGISVSRYLNRHWDATIFGTRGVAGYFGHWNPDPAVPTHFVANLTTLNLLARYNFFDPNFWMRPYICAGAGILFQSGIGDSYVNRGKKFDMAVPEIGAGINFKIGPIVGIQLQELFMYQSADDIDLVQTGMNDMYLLHTIGVTFNLGKFSRFGDKQGSSIEVDKCPKVKQHRNKITKNESKSLRKEKRMNKRAVRKARRVKS
jgi:OOP family OmpA-OmpF porin